MPRKIAPVTTGESESNGSKASQPKFEPPKISEFGALTEVTLAVLS
ncbi:MAG: hypothetical protein ABR543_16900 [Gemmatimonadaceae bacterium]